MVTGGEAHLSRRRFLDYTGKFMLHCHMMNHEELGMMQTVEVYGMPDGCRYPSSAAGYDGHGR